MINFIARSLSQSQFNAEVLRFMVAGITAVTTDFLSYYLLSHYINISFAKGVSFIWGSIVAYFINKFWTFDAAKNHWHDMFKFTVLYTCTLGANVFSNKLVLFCFSDLWLLAFLFATGVSTVLNFIGMKFWVFHQR